MTPEQGKTVDEVIEEIGTPDEVAERFNEELEEYTIEKKGPLAWLFLIFAAGSVVYGAAQVILYFVHPAKSISVIGGVDGPTSVFFAGREGAPWILALSCLGLCMVGGNFCSILCRILDFSVYRWCIWQCPAVVIGVTGIFWQGIGYDSRTGRDILNRCADHQYHQISEREKSRAKRRESREMYKIVIVEDDRKLNEGIRLALKREDCTFIQCQTIGEARRAIRQNEVQLILLDLNLPDGNGMDFLKEIRENSGIPVIIITANNMETDIVMGLEAGANDYITKPFSLMVLRARASVQLRQNRSALQSRYQTDEFSFDFEKMVFLVGGNSVELSKTEQKLLRILVENRGSTLKRGRLIDEVWSGDREYVDEHALTVTIKRLRDKLEADSKNPCFINTVYGIGYTWTIE